MRSAQIELPPKLVPAFLGEADYRGAFGGRGSAKSRSFAKMTAVRGYQWAVAGEPGLIVCGREFMNSLDESSLSEVKAAILSEPWLADFYELGDKFIRTRDHLIEYDFIGLRHNLNSVKSKARIRLLWVDEAEPVSETAWEKAIPSVREDGSEIWVTWNPERKASATNKRFREDPPASSKIVEINWRDNPWFPATLDRKRREDFEKRPEQYKHIWEGDFRTVFAGAYYAKELAELSSSRRLGRVARDPLMTLRAIWDIGGTGQKADGRSIWICQFVAREIRVLDYRETRGQALSADVEWLRTSGYKSALCSLPHDGDTNDRVHDVSYRSYLEEAGFEVEVIENQGKGAALKRIEASRRLFPSIWVNEETTRPGMEALGAYHAKIDEQRQVDLGPEHDWASHAADAWGLMCVVYEKPVEKNTAWERKPQRWVA